MVIFHVLLFNKQCIVEINRWYYMGGRGGGSLSASTKHNFKIKLIEALTQVHSFKPPQAHTL